MRFLARNKLKEYLFVIIQFSGIAFIFFTGPFFAKSNALLFFEVSGVLLGIWAVLTMRPGNTRILPDLKKSAVFVRSGPYRLIRHPMYLAIIVALTALVLDFFSYFRILVLLIVVIDLVVKLNYEEKILANSFEDYFNYQLSTYRLIPLVY
ncbi:MAG: isoprenylcysteine carboxylmethyltransferase family protein [Bacteroidales bacterium]